MEVVQTTVDMADQDDFEYGKGQESCQQLSKLEFIVAGIR